MKKFFFGIALLLSLGGASAFPIDTLNSSAYRNFKYLKELWVCSSHAFPVNVSYNVFGVALTPQSGYYLQVEPGSHKNGSSLPSTVITSSGGRFDGVFNISGRLAGAYEFVYINESDNFCGMTRGEQALVRIYLVPELVGNTILSNVCAGNSFNVRLSDYLPYEVKNFTDSAGWLIDFYDARTHSRLTNPEVEASLGYVGTRDYYYKINDKVGPFVGKFSKIRQGWACADSGLIAHTVKIRDTIRLVKDTVKVTFCKENLRRLSENRYFNVSLPSLLSVAADGGTWKWSTRSGLPAIIFKGLLPDNTVPGGELIVDMGYFDTPVFLNIPALFNYTFKNCDGSDASGVVSIIFTDDMSRVISGGTGTICRNLGSGVLDLGIFFGFSVPITAGIWLDMQKAGTKEHEILSGSIDLTNLKVGSLYHYQYKVHQASLDLCGTGYASAGGGNAAWADYYLKIRDIEVLSGSAQMCRSLYNTQPGAVVNLYDYVPGLADPNFIDPNEVLWHGPDGHIITPSGAQNYPISGTAKDTTLTFSFVYSNECGKAPGNLYISIVDSLPSDLHKRLQLCYTDDQASYVNLFQVLGVAGLKGAFELESSVPPGKNIVWINQNNGVFDAFETFDAANNSETKETYTFKYTPDPSEQGCIANGAKVSITITRNVE
jgi:hypothetical protein